MEEGKWVATACWEEDEEEDDEEEEQGKETRSSPRLFRCSSTSTTCKIDRYSIIFFFEQETASPPA